MLFWGIQWSKRYRYENCRQVRLEIEDKLSRFALGDHSCGCLVRELRGWTGSSPQSYMESIKEAPAITSVRKNVSTTTKMPWPLEENSEDVLFCCILCTVGPYVKPWQLLHRNQAEHHPRKILCQIKISGENGISTSFLLPHIAS